jgi:hypothetical protein
VILIDLLYHVMRGMTSDTVEECESGHWVAVIYLFFLRKTRYPRVEIASLQW